MSDDETKKKRPRQDEIVGLNVGGCLHYSHRSTLTTMNAKGSSIAARIDENSIIPAGSEYKDDHGRTVYFFDRNGHSFQYILDFLRKNSVNLPSFEQKPELWRDVREEAEYYGVQGLLERLYVTHEIKRNDTARGIFYWLGTKKSKEDSYINPHDRGQVRVFNGLDDGIPNLSRIGDPDHVTPGALVEFQAPVFGFRQSDPVAMIMCDARTKCCFFRNPIFSVVVDLCTILVRPTAYSLRYSGGRATCANWNLEASLDGKDDDEWDVLHKARNDQNLKAPSYSELRDLCESIDRLRYQNNTGAAFQLPLLYAEDQLRHTWDIDEVSKFYRFFRFTSVPGNNDEGNDGLDAVGFEIFGDIHEP